MRPAKRPASESRPYNKSSSQNLCALLVPSEDGFADARNCFLGFSAGAFRTAGNHFDDSAFVVLPLHAPLANRRNPFDQVVGHFRLALDTPDPRRAAPLCRPFQGCWGREQFMPIVDGTHVRISGIGPPFPSWVRHHHFGLFANVVVGFAQRDGIPITLRHFPPVEAGDAGGFGEHYTWFR